MTLAPFTAYTAHGPDGICTCCPRRDGTRTKAAVLASVNAAAPADDKARIDEAILRVARRGGVFSANDFRDDFPESGPIIGARMNALARKHFEHVGYVASSKPNTNGHEIKTWRLVT